MNLNARTGITHNLIFGSRAKRGSVRSVRATEPRSVCGSTPGESVMKRQSPPRAKKQYQYDTVASFFDEHEGTFVAAAGRALNKKDANAYAIGLRGHSKEIQRLCCQCGEQIRVVPLNEKELPICRPCFHALFGDSYGENNDPPNGPHHLRTSSDNHAAS